MDLLTFSILIASGLCVSGFVIQRMRWRRAAYRQTPDPVDRTPLCITGDTVETEFISRWLSQVIGAAVQERVREIQFRANPGACALEAWPICCNSDRCAKRHVRAVTLHQWRALETLLTRNARRKIGEYGRTIILITDRAEAVHIHARDVRGANKRARQPGTIFTFALRLPPLEHLAPTASPRHASEGGSRCCGGGS